MTTSKKVVTWQAPNGQTINVCEACEREATAAHEWPRNSRGEEYCSVSRGLHHGHCTLCDSPTQSLEEAVAEEIEYNG